MTILISVQIDHQISDLVVDRAHHDSNQRRKEKEKCKVGKLLNVMPKRLGLVLIYYSLLSVSVDVVHSFHIKDSPGCDFIQPSLLLQKGHVEDGPLHL